MLLFCCFQMGKSDWQAAVKTAKDVSKSITTVAGGLSVMTRSMMLMRQLPAFSLDLGKVGESRV